LSAANGVQGATVTASGQVQGATVSSTGAVNSASLTTGTASVTGAATAGNLSVFDREIGELWITSSGKHKGRLKEEDFICMNLDGKILRETTNKPSAEASIHQVIYRQIPSACAVLHVHTVTSCKLQFGIQKWHPATRFLLPNVEILKAFGDFREEPNFSVIVTFNHGSVVDISSDLENALRESSSDVPFFLIENHGLTVWGKSVEDANKNLEAAEFILQVMLK
jgi:methylthioribulose-1-phosphate dehydratase